MADAKIMHFSLYMGHRQLDILFREQCSLNDMVVTIGGKVRSVEDLLSADELMHLAIEASGRE
ncbi:hypothetical protein, partial [Chitinivorax sp. B]|uniref:hypothetical protein n=1 Tax=Chitinivorax sp. B TaxID=2502235 RepID=UPI001BB183EF